MKKYSFILAAAAVSMLVACNKEQDMPVSENLPQEAQLVRTPGWTYIGAQAGDVTKSSIDDESAAFSWNTGDQIAVFSGDTYYVSQPLASTYDGTNAAVFAFDSDIESGRKDFAVYPANLVMDGTEPWYDCGEYHDASQLHIVLPGSYKLSEVQDNVSPTPMIAVNTPGAGLEFKSICALVRVTVNFIPKDATYIKVSFPGIRVQGDFDISGVVAGTSALEASDAFEEGEDDTITITDLGITGFTDQLVINVPIPVGVVSSEEYLFVRVGAYDSFTNPETSIVYVNKINSIDVPLNVVNSAPTSWVPGRKSSRKVAANLPYFTTNTKTGKKVVIAPGNLQATVETPVSASGVKVGAAKDWRFAKHQYDALGDCAGNRIEAANEDIDLFAYIGESATYSFKDNEKYGVIWPALSSTYLGNAVESLKYPWSELFNGVTYPKDTWRVPGAESDGESYNEQYRICDSGRSTTNKYISAKATIKDGEDIVARGLIVFPDKYEHPYGFKTINNHGGGSSMRSSHWSGNVITVEEWDILEKQGGCCFYPVTSVRDRTGSSGAYASSCSVYFGDAAYWNHYMNDKNNGAAMIISDAEYCETSRDGSKKTNLNSKKSVGRQCGVAVRLIRDVN